MTVYEADEHCLIPASFFSDLPSPKSSDTLVTPVVSTFLAARGLDAKKVFSADVLGKPIFISLLNEVAAQWSVFSNRKSQYDGLKVKSRNTSKLKSAIEDALKTESSATELLRKMSAIQIHQSEIFTQHGERSRNDKLELLSKATVMLTNLKRQYKQAIDRLVVRNAQMLHKSRTCSMTAEKVFLDTFHGVSLSWERALDAILDALNGNSGDESVTESPGNLPFQQLYDIAMVIQNTNGLPLKGLIPEESRENMSNIRRQLMYWLPIMIVQYDDISVVVNCHDFHVDLPFNTFSDLMTVDVDETSNSDDAASLPNDRMNLTPMEEGQRGRPRKHEQFPAIVRHTLDFISSHGFSAQERRRTDTANSSGVTLAEIRKYLMDKIPELKTGGISRNTIQRLMQAPHKGRRSQSYYKGLVGARVPRKDNSALYKEHEDRQFCSSLVKACVEFGRRFENDTLVLSCDNMNKVNVGVLAVSRYHQIRRFFMTTDSPCYPDHDFPAPNSKISPAGYLVLLPTPDEDGANSLGKLHSVSRRCRSASPMRNKVEQGTRSRSLSPPKRKPIIGDFVKDKLGRLHYKYHRTGKLHVFTRVCRYWKIDSETHLNDMTVLLNEYSDKPGCVMIVDGGPDYAPRSHIVFHQMGRLWRDARLDYLVLVCYAPGDSARNPIEHAWSRLSKLLTGVTLANTIPGEDKPPMQQTDITADERLTKDILVFNRANMELVSYWNRKEYAGHDIKATPVQHDSLVNQPYTDGAKVDEMYKASIKTMNAKPELQKYQKESEFLSKHCTRSKYMVCFIKCEDERCTHCPEHPVVAKEAVEYIRNAGGVPFIPTPSRTHDTHFESFLEYASAAEFMKRTPVLRNLGKNCPSTEAAEFCTTCNRYLILSDADKTRHQRCAHPMDPKVRGKKLSKIIVHKCTFPNCGKVFKSRHKCWQHKQAAGHVMNQGRQGKK